YTVHYYRYSEPLDLTGKSTWGLLGKPKAQVSACVGHLVPKTEMPLVERSVEFTCPRRGELPDEVHHWPNALIGGKPYDLKQFFLNDVFEGEVMKPLTQR